MSKCQPETQMPEASEASPLLIECQGFVDSDRDCDDLVATIEAADDGDDAKPTFRARVYSGDRMRPRFNGYASPTPVVIDLQGVRVDRRGSKLPVLYAHERGTPIGHTSRVDVGTSAITAEGVLSVPSERQREVIGAAKNGYRWAVSVGFEATEREFITAGETAMVNGRTMRGPLYIARKGTVKEISLLSIGAEASAAATVSAASGDNAPPAPGLTVDKDLRDYIEAQGFDVDQLNKDQVEFFEASFAQSKKADEQDGAPETRQAATPGGTDSIEATDPDPDPLIAERKRRADEARRVHAIDQICAEYKGVTAKAEDGTEQPLDVVAIEAGWTPDQTELHAMRARRPRSPAIHTSGKAKTHTLDSIQCGLMLRAGVKIDSSVFRGFDSIEAGMPEFLTSDVNSERFQKAAEQGRKFRGASMIEAAAQVVELETGDRPVGKRDLIEAAFSSNAVANLFGTTVGARTLQTFREVPDTTAGWTRRTTVPDFLEHDRVGLDAMGGLKRVRRGDEAEHAKRSSKGEKVQVARYGLQYTIDEQDLIDDRLNLLDATPRQMGQAAGRLIPELVYWLLLSNPTMARTGAAAFTSGEGTLLTAAAFGKASLSAMISSLMKQKDGNVTLNLTPTHIITGTELADEVVQLTGSAMLSNDSGAGARNPMARYGLAPVADARISNGVNHPDTGVLAGGSTTAFYIASTDGDGIEVQTLDQTGGVPMTRTTNLTQGKWGIHIDTKFDVGAKMVENRTFRRNAGA
ncbi:MAG: hypothetical protein AAF958_14175 [Planctomycetota bacterium]